jgi:hypothetical protein
MRYVKRLPRAFWARHKYGRIVPLTRTQYRSGWWMYMLPLEQMLRGEWVAGEFEQYDTEHPTRDLMPEDVSDAHQRGLEGHWLHHHPVRGDILWAPNALSVNKVTGAVSVRPGAVPLTFAEGAALHHAAIGLAPYGIEAQRELPWRVVVRRVA